MADAGKASYLCTESYLEEGVWVFSFHLIPAQAHIPHPSGVITFRVPATAVDHLFGSVFLTGKHYLFDIKQL